MLSTVEELKLHHVGIVVPSIQKACVFWSLLVTKADMKIEYIDSQKVNICLLPFGEINLELIEPSSCDSPVYSFAQQGGGFHHLCYETRNLERSIYNLVQQKFRLLVKPVLGFEQRTIAFLINPFENTGVEIIELASRRSE